MAVWREAHIRGQMSSWEERGDSEDLSGNSLAVQWLGLHAFAAEGAGSSPRWGTKSLQAVWHGQIEQNKKTKQQPARRVEACHTERQ